MSQIFGYIELRIKQRFVYATLAGIKPMTQEIPHFIEIFIHFIHLRAPVTLKLGQGTEI